MFILKKKERKQNYYSRQGMHAARANLRSLKQKINAFYTFWISLVDLLLCNRNSRAKFHIVR